MIAMADNKRAAEITRDPAELFRLHSHVAEICASRAWGRYRYRVQGQLDRDDLAQICLTALHLAARTYTHGMGTFEGYAYRCCKNAMIDMARASRFRELSNFDSLESFPATTREISSTSLMSAVYSLPRDMCSVVLMSYGLAGYREHTQVEIAAKLGCTRSRVQLLARAARDALGAILSPS